MRFSLIWSSIIVLTIFTNTICHANNDKTELTNHAQRLGYALGLDIGSSLRQMNPKINFNSLLRGIKDSYAGNKYLLSAQETERLKQDFATSRHSKRQKQIDALGKINLKEGLVFLATNKHKKDILTTDSGLQYKIIKKGSGAKPGSNDVVTLNYIGKLLDGTTFYNSYKAGKPNTGITSSFIPGISEALQLMKEGSRYKIFVPARLAYGYKGFGAKIGPYAVLIYDIELLKVRTIPNKKHKTRKATPQLINKLIVNNNTNSGIVLSSPDSAVFAVYSAYTTQLTPGTNSKNISTICQKISTPAYISSCKNIFKQRLSFIKDFVKADFLKIKREINADNGKARVSWIEIFQKKNRTSKKYKNEMMLQLTHLNKKWKISKISLNKHEQE